MHDSLLAANLAMGIDLASSIGARRHHHSYIHTYELQGFIHTLQISTFLLRLISRNPHDFFLCIVLDVLKYDIKYLYPRCSPDGLCVHFHFRDNLERCQSTISIHTTDNWFICTSIILYKFYDSDQYCLLKNVTSLKNPTLRQGATFLEIIKWDKKSLEVLGHKSIRIICGIRK